MFCHLRSLLRLSDEELRGGPRQPASAPLGPLVAAQRLQAVAADLQRDHHELRQHAPTLAAASGPFQPEAIVLKYLDRYGDGLVGHPVLRDAAGRAVAVVDRTNNVIEQSFAIAKQGLRRRNRAWAKEAQLSPLLPTIHSQTRSELQVSN